MRNLYPDLVMVDGGGVGVSAQPNAAWQVTMLWQAMTELGYDVISLGERDSGEETFEWIKSRKSGMAFLAGNLVTTKSFAGNIAVVSRNGMKIGIVAAVSEKIIMRNPHYKSEPLQQYLDGVKKDLAAEQVDFKVLLYHGSAYEARNLAKTEKDFDLILVGHGSGKPMSSQFYVNSVPIVGPGDRGRELALVTLKKGAGAKPEVTCDIVPLDDAVASSPKGEIYIKKAKDFALQKAKKSSNGTK